MRETADGRRSEGEQRGGPESESVHSVQADLERLSTGASPLAARRKWLRVSAAGTWGQDIPWHWIGGVGAVLMVMLLGFLLRGNLRPPGASKHRPFQSFLYPFCRSTMLPATPALTGWGLR